MVKEIEKIREENGVIYADIITFNKQGVMKIIDTRVKGYKKSKQPKFTGRSKKSNYTPSPKTISNNSKRGVYKNIKRTKKIEKTNKIIKTYLKNDKEAFNGLFTYTADLNNTKNENKEIVKTIYNNRETIEVATTKEKKLELRDKIYDDFLTDANTKKYSKTLLKHSMFSLPPNLKLDKSIQAEILQKVIIETIDEMEEFKGHKYYLNLHEDQVNSNGGVHCHIVMAMHNGKGHSLHTKTRTELQQRDMKFKQKMTYNLYQQGIELDNPEKPPFTPDLHKELTFLEVTRDKKVLVMDKEGEIRELKFKGCDEKAKDLKLGDKFDYVRKENKDKPKLDKDGNHIYIKGKPQFEIEPTFENIQTQEQIKEQVIEEQKQIIENRPENKLAREIEAHKKEISGIKGIFKTKSQKAEIEAKIKNKELAVKAIQLKDAIKDLTKTDIALMYYHNNDFIKPNEKQPQFTKDIYTIDKNFKSIEQYLDDEVKENIKENIIEPYIAINETMKENPIIRNEKKIYSKSEQQKTLQEALIRRYPDITNRSTELEQLQEQRERKHYDTIRQYQYNSTEQSKSISKSKSNEVKPNTPTRTIPPSQKKKKMEKDREW